MGTVEYTLVKFDVEILDWENNMGKNEIDIYRIGESGYWEKCIGKNVRESIFGLLTFILCDLQYIYRPLLIE